MIMLFYSSVILNSTETKNLSKKMSEMFYSSVILNSTETIISATPSFYLFYSSVILLSKLLGNYNQRQY